ncbi:MAG: protease modulator HflC [Anderseniella sp.]
MGIFKSFGMVILGAIALIVWMSVFKVDERQSALVTQLGDIKREINEPGFYFKVPLVQEVVKIEDRIVLFESNDKSVQVVDGRRYLVDTVTMYRVSNPRRFRETVEAELSIAENRIETRLDAALRQTYGRRTFDAALSKDRAAMMREIRDQVRGEADSLGIEVVDVKIRRTDLMPDVLKDTYDRMNAERFAEAAELRAIGEAQATRIKAEADRQAVELVSMAQRESEILRGEGDAKRNAVFADAFQKDPEFFSFYRSMQAYSKSLSNSGTTLVLKPDSEFFQYFGTQQSAPAAAQQQ